MHAFKPTFYFWANFGLMEIVIMLSKSLTLALLWLIENLSLLRNATTRGRE